MKLVFSHVYDKSGNYIFPYCSPEESTPEMALVSTRVPA